ncbi:MAG: TrpB-like pyridoxal phosphate-dependent enzyme [Endomicrobiia bacterium]|nr:TrpB-like pyridoxal phosphate-dependent enzyme [Endomicrobiaceae bacterium]MDD3053013.1 TrpB-like pyridoxal phosphate-dependent enzyme [Endomicrobiaceae bacterium]MDD3922149.1 TrpB-like pyridoxal phosphate-dependent enzyme [Endomicrobiaceae bacterium]MDD5101392.1 TrpB-like pyridoxal phosphate-dependent enzyme [Endomicrobiaceae bacterium]
MSKENKKIILSEQDIPKQWYNIQADLPEPLEPAFNMRTGKIATKEDLCVIFPEEIVEQEVSQQRWIDIPEEVRDIYKIWRPSPLIRARNLEKFLDTPAKIYFKNEGVSPSGSHKSNSAVAQAYYNKKAGTKRIATETGAGQWGSALAMACQMFGIECVIYMVKVSFEQKPYRKSLMHVYGANVFSSPSNETEVGRKVLASDPDCRGSLGIAISEAIEDVLNHKNAKYSLGSVLNHVALHQTVIGLEAKKQLEMVDEYPDVVIACLGGGSNFSGIAFPFLMDKIQGRNPNLRAIAVEPSACPKLSKGVYAYDYGDNSGFTPAFKMYTLGHTFIPSGIHAGGLRYHGASPLVSAIVKHKLAESVVVGQKEVFEAAITFTKCEGILPAPESAHAIRTAIDEALKAKKEGVSKTILFNLSGHGHFDLSAYEQYLSGQIQDCNYSEEDVKKALEDLPKVNI